ncbi:MAG: FAD-dependent oxidoreductase [Planctomycetota bacterium]
MKIGIIGTGIAGLSAGWYLQKAGFDVVMFERGPGPGISGHGIAIPGLNGDAKIDVPLRLVNGSQWPQLLELYREIGVGICPVDSSQSFSQEEAETYLELDLLGQFTLDPRMLFNLKAAKIAREIKRLRTAGRQFLEAPEKKMGFIEFLQRNRFSDEFVYGFLFPVLSSTVCTCSYDALRNYPASVILRSLKKITDAESMKPGLHRVTGGVSAVADRLLHSSVTAKFGMNINEVKKIGRKIQIEYRCGKECDVEAFDHVVVATQANQALNFLNQEMQAEIDLLNRVRYEAVEVLLHQDSRLLPREKNEKNEKNRWATFNMICRKSEAATCSIWLNRFLGIESSKNWFQSINPISEPDPELVVHRVCMERPVVDDISVDIWSSLDEMHGQPDRQIWFTGSYSTPGVPLLENGVVASKLIADRIIAIAQVTMRV